VAGGRELLPARIIKEDKMKILYKKDNGKFNFNIYFDCSEVYLPTLEFSIKKDNGYKYKYCFHIIIFSLFISIAFKNN